MRRYIRLLLKLCQQPDHIMQQSRSRLSAASKGDEQRFLHRLLAGLRGVFQNGIAGWRLRLTRPTKTNTQHSDTNRRPVQAQCRRAQPHHHPSFIIAKNRFTVRERSNRRQQSAISVKSSGEVNA